MIKPVSLKTKKDKWGNYLFAFANTFPEYDRTKSISIREKAIAEWGEYLAGKRDQLTHKYIAVLLSIVPEKYELLLKYIFSHPVIDEEIALILFKQIHPSWTENPYFQQLIQIKDYFANYTGSSSKIQHLKENLNFLFDKNSVEELSAFLSEYFKKTWSDVPRDARQLEKIKSILEYVCKTVYQDIIPDNDNIDQLCFPKQVLSLFLQRVDANLALAKNFTQDFIVNPSVTQNSLERKILSNISDFVVQRKEELLPEYRKKLVSCYVGRLQNSTADTSYLEKMEQTVKDIYSLYPVDYERSNNLPEESFVKSVIEELIKESYPSIVYSSSFMRDIRLCTRYPNFKKILGKIILENKNQWHQDSEKTKHFYLNDLLKEYLHLFEGKQYDAQYIRLLESIEEQFRDKFYDPLEKDLYDNMLMRFLKGLVEKTLPSLSLCDSQVFFTDFRLSPIIAKTPFLSQVLKSYSFNKVDVLIQYIYDFEKRRIFDQLNEVADFFINYTSSFQRSIRQMDPGAYKILRDYINLQKIINTFAENDPVATERRNFWIKMRKHATDIFKIYQTSDRLLFLAEFGSRLVLDSTKYAEACYVYYGISSSFLDQQIQYQLNFSQGNLRPLDVGREFRREQVRHTSNWQYYLEELLLSMPS